MVEKKGDTSWCKRLSYHAKDVGVNLMDVGGDWFFFFKVLENNGRLLDSFAIAVLTFCVISTIMCILFLRSVRKEYSLGGFTKLREDSKVEAAFVVTILGLQIVVEDIPQFILTTMYSMKMRSLTYTAIFNYATSALDMIKNIYDIFKRDEHGDSKFSTWREVAAFYISAKTSGGDKADPLVTKWGRLC